MEKFKINKPITAINLLFLIAIMVGDVFFIIYDDFWVKTITSLAFVLLGAINLIYAIKKQKSNLNFCIIMLIGLFFAMLGDVLLEIDFIIGAALFAVGHVFYFIAYCFLEKFSWWDLLAGAIIFIPSLMFILFAPILEFDSLMMKILVIAYALIISLMLGKATSNFIRNRNVLNFILFLGSFLFFFSDLMLLLRNFAHMSVVVKILCLVTYYIAEWLLASSLLFTKTKK